MSQVQDDEVLFDIRRSSRWLFDDDVEDMDLMVPIMLISLGVGLLFFFTFPAILILASGDTEYWSYLVFSAGIPFIVISIGIGYYRTVGRKRFFPRITRRAVQIPDLVWSKVYLKKIRKTIPLQSLEDIYLEPGWKGMDFVIKYKDEDEKEQTFMMDYSEDGPGYEADIYGFMEALDKVHPEGSQPTSEEFMASLKDAGTGIKAPASAYMRHESDWAAAFGFVIYYLSMFFMVHFFFSHEMGFFSDPLVITLMFVPVIIILLIITTPLFLMLLLLPLNQSFNDRLLKDFKIEGDSAKIPIPLMARLTISRRPHIKVSEIREVRLHLVQFPLSHLAAIEMADGSTFLVSDDVFDELARNPLFERSGRRLINTSEPWDKGGSVARVNWTAIRLLLLAPLLLSISLAISELATLL